MIRIPNMFYCILLLALFLSRFVFIISVLWKHFGIKSCTISSPNPGFNDDVLIAKCQPCLEYLLHGNWWALGVKWASLVA